MKTYACLILAVATAFGAPAALAQHIGEVAAQLPAPAAEERNGSGSVLGQRPDQALYKGVVGTLLEAVPMDADARVELQRTNAVVSAPFSARSLALLLGITNPVVMIGGLVWGIWAASQIEPPKVAAKAPEAAPPRVDIAFEAAASD